jgi:hypothetical protein
LNFDSPILLEIFRDAVSCLNYVFFIRVFEYNETERNGEKKGKEKTQKRGR